MATRKEFNVHPLDLKKNTAIGVMLPLGGVPIFKSSYTTEEQAISNLKNLILTRKGERPMQPLLGTEIYSLLFENMDSQLEIDLEKTLREDIEFWLPYIIIDKLDVNVNEDENRVNISMNFKVTNSGANQNITMVVTPQGQVTIV